MRDCCYIGARNTGKTTILKDSFLKLRCETSTFIFVIDSAVEEGDRSLIRQLQNAGHDGNYFSFKSPEDLTAFRGSVFESSPVYCDVSYYLERGYEAENQKRKREFREQYKNLVADILETILSTDWQEKKLVIIMDEIEVNGRAAQIILDHLSGVKILVAVHDPSYLPKDLLDNIRVVTLSIKYQ